MHNPQRPGVQRPSAHLAASAEAADTFDAIASVSEESALISCCHKDDADRGEGEACPLDPAQVLTEYYSG